MCLHANCPAARRRSLPGPSTPSVVTGHHRGGPHPHRTCNHVPNGKFTPMMVNVMVHLQACSVGGRGAATLLTG